MVAEMLANAAKKDRDMEDVSQDQAKHGSQKESPWRSVSEDHTQDKTPNMSNLKSE